MKNKISSNEYAFLYFLQHGINGGSSWELPKDFSFENLFKESVHQALAGVLLNGVLVAGFDKEVPEEIKKAWKKKALKEYLFCSNLLEEQKRVLETFDKSGIKCAVLKGSSVSAYYADPALRSQSDMDILVAKKDLKDGLSLLKEMGYVEQEGESDHHCNVKKDKVLIEVHYTLGGASDKNISEELNGLFSDFTERLEEIESNGYKVPTLSFPFQAVSLLMHIIQHMMKAGVGFKQLCDWAVFASAKREEDEYRICTDILKKLGIYKFACIVSGFCRMWLDVKIDGFDDFMPDQDDLLLLLDDMFAGGNFGKKDINRYRSHYLLNKATGETNLVVRLFRSAVAMQRVAVLRHPIFKKVFIIRPFAFLCIPCGYFFRVITKKNDKSALKKTMNIAKERNRIYKNMNLFKKQ